MERRAFYISDSATFIKCSSCLPAGIFGPGSHLWTGTTGNVVKIRLPARVYPRVHGGTGIKVFFPPGNNGLSPRTRGNPWAVPQQAIAHGSIPAYTGEPPAGQRRSKARGVYPRVHGGTRICSRFVIEGSGLSPRTRGNLAKFCAGLFGPRSIPAYTGEPSSANSKATLGRVYPRVHGGTRGAVGGVAAERGLSPRTRGNP